jgi:hypothetical protein
MKEDDEVEVVANAIGYTFQVLRERSAELGEPVVEQSLAEREWIIAAAIKAIAHLDGWRSQESARRAVRHGLL